VISIIIPVWNKMTQTAECLAHLVPLLEPEDQLIVVDNGSTDETQMLLEYWQRIIPKQMDIIRNEENRGFGGANNQGAELARNPILLWMSNDVIVKNKFQPELERIFSDSQNSVGCARIVDWRGGWNEFGDLVIPYAEGWFIAVTKQFFEVVGGFDERFSPCDYEDVDLSYRAAQAGYKLVQGKLPVQHRSGVTATQLDDRVAITVRNRRLFAEKWGLMP